MVRSQLNSYSGADPIWGFVALIGNERFTGEAAVGVDPRLRLFAVDGHVYFAERDGDLPIGTRLVNCGAVTATQLEHGSVRIGDTDSLARLFQRQPLIDRDAVELTIELATEALLESVADKPVGMPEVFPLRHHPAGIHHWARPATAPSGSVPMAAAPLTLPTAPEAAEPAPDVAPALHLAAIEVDTDTPAVAVESTPEPFTANEPDVVAAEPEFVAAEPEFGLTEPTFAATEPEFEIAEPIFAETEPVEVDAAEPAFEAAPLAHFEPLPLSAQIAAEAPTAGDTSEADTPTLQVPVLEADSSVFAPTPSSNGAHASWQPAESIFAAADDVTEEATTDTATESSTGFDPLPSTNGFGGRTLPSLTPLPPVEDHADETDTAMSEFGAAAATDHEEPAHAEPVHESTPLNGFTALPTLGSMSSSAPEPEPVVDIFAPEAPAEVPTESTLPSFSSLSSLQPLQPPAPSEPVEVAEAVEAPEADALPAPALPTLASLPTLGSSTAADFFDSLPEAGAYEPGVMPADLPKLASAPISMSDLAAANAEPAGPWNGATHNLAAVQIWEMVDDILDDGQSREPEMAAGGGSEKRGRGWLRGRKG